VAVTALSLFVCSQVGQIVVSGSDYCSH